MIMEILAGNVKHSMKSMVKNIHYSMGTSISLNILILGIFNDIEVPIK
jgi:hypothetical protein